MRSYYAFFSKEVPQVKNITPTSSIIASTITITITVSIIIIITAHIVDGAAAASSDGAVLVASATQVVSVTNAHRNVQIQNPGTSTAGGDFAPARFGFLRRVRVFCAANLPNWAAAAHVDSGPARAVGPLSGLGLAGGVAPGTWCAVYFPGDRSSGEQLRSGRGVTRGPASREWPYVNVQFRRTRSASVSVSVSASTFFLFLLRFLFLFVVVRVFLITFSENILPPLR